MPESTKRGSGHDLITRALRQNGTNTSVIEMTPPYTMRRVTNSLNSGAAQTLTLAQSGIEVNLDTATTAIALPAIGADDVGVYFDFYCSVVATSQVITAQAADLLTGYVAIIDFDTANTLTSFAPNGSSHLVTTLNGGTKGGKIGSWLRYRALSATLWGVSGILYGDGTLATPFS